MSQSLKNSVVLILLLSPLSCKETPPGPHTSTTFLSVEDVSCTEVWLKVSISSPAVPQTVAIQRDNRTIVIAVLTSTDSVFVDDSLQPNHAYSYQAQRMQNSVVIETSTPVQATTMDTTSNELTWLFDTLGVTSSELLDVAIMNDTLAYAVGEMYLNDTTGTLDPIRYNFAVLNGQRWVVVRIPYYYQGYPSYSRIKWLFALSANDIWFENSTHWNGQQFDNADVGTSVFYGVGSNKMWGGSAIELYVVGNSGTIARSQDQASTWERVQSGTTLDVVDVYGAADKLTAGDDVLAVASKFLVNPDRRLMRIAGSTVTALSDSGIASTLNGIWFVPERHYYVVGYGVYEKRSLRDVTWSHATGVSHLYAVRGTGLNDVFACGDFGEVLHFNGITWHSFINQTGLSGGIYYALAVKGTSVVAVGVNNSRGIVARGNRQW